MAKSGPNRKPSSERLPAAEPAGPQGKEPGLAPLRAEIDRIDRMLVSLMNERATVAGKIGHHKRATGQQTYDPSREEIVLERVAGNNPVPVSAEILKAV